VGCIGNGVFDFWDTYEYLTELRMSSTNQSSCYQTSIVLTNLVAMLANQRYN